MRALKFTTGKKAGRFAEMTELLQELVVLSESPPTATSELFRKYLTLQIVRLTPPPEVLRALQGV